MAGGREEGGRKMNVTETLIINHLLKNRRLDLKEVQGDQLNMVVFF